MRVILGLGLSVLVVFGTGCGYMSDRGRDAADIFTLTGGLGLGATARVGPVHAGLYAGGDLIGLKGGELEWNIARSYKGEWGETMDLLFGMPTPGGWFFAMDRFQGKRDETGDTTVAKMRAKAYEAKGYYPFVVIPSALDRSSVVYASPNYHGKYPYYYWTQMEIAVGLGVSVRAGFNPGELVDFVLGWFGIDIYNDDLSRIKKDHAKENTEPSHDSPP